MSQLFKFVAQISCEHYEITIIFIIIDSQISCGFINEKKVGGTGKKLRLSITPNCQ